jgi:hypothetical protein
MCPTRLVFFNSRFGMFIQVGTLGSRSVVQAPPPTIAGYVGSMGAGCCYWVTEGSPEYFISMQR